jgi:hypothetical protein
MAICASPQLFAAYHVLHRLLVPRHPPCALISLTSYSYASTYERSEFSFRRILSQLILRNLDGTRQAIDSFCCVRCTLCATCRVFIIQFSRYKSFTSFSRSGGDNEIRTHDPLLARQVLSQLSYTPTQTNVTFEMDIQN